MIFYHVHAVNNWKWVVQDQLSKLIYSGLYNYATEARGGSAARCLILSLATLGPLTAADDTGPHHWQGSDLPHALSQI